MLQKEECANQENVLRKMRQKKKEPEEEVAEKRSAAISLCGQPPLTFITPTNRQQ